MAGSPRYFQALLRNGISARSRLSLRKRPSHSTTPIITGANQGSPTRTWVAVAPPRYPVKRMAPRTDVCGITYSAVQISSRTPSPFARCSGSPNFANPSEKPAGFTNFMMALISSIRTGSVLRTRPVQTIPLEDGAEAGATSIFDDILNPLLINIFLTEAAYEDHPLLARIFYLSPNDPVCGRCRLRHALSLFSHTENLVRPREHT